MATTSWHCPPLTFQPKNSSDPDKQADPFKYASGGQWDTRSNLGKPMYGNTGEWKAYDNDITLTPKGDIWNKSRTQGQCFQCRTNGRHHEGFYNISATPDNLEGILDLDIGEGRTAQQVTVFG